jgi:small-conductance mechanosensitive channel
MAAVRVVAERLFDFVFLAMGMILAFVWVERVMGAFAYTAPYSDQMLQIIIGGAATFGLELVDSIPGLVIVILIIFFTLMLLQAGSSVIDQLAKFRVGWLDQETAAPTRRIMNMFLWIFALVMAYPHLPGADSDAFKGISVLLGLMVSLGASSIVGQAASGLIVLYKRVLKPDEWVTVGESEGRVDKIGMFTTTLVLRTGERVSVPNVKIIQDRVVNHSRSEMRPYVLSGHMPDLGKRIFGD